MRSGRHAKAHASIVVISLLVLLLRGPGFRVEVSYFGGQVEDGLHIPGNRAKAPDPALMPDRVDGTTVGEQSATADINTTPTELIVNGTAQDEFTTTLSVGESALVNITVSPENSGAGAQAACVVGKPVQAQCQCGTSTCGKGNICIDYRPEEREAYCEPVGSSQEASTWETDLYEQVSSVDIWTMNKAIQKSPFTMFDGHVAFFTIWSHFDRIPRGFVKAQTVEDTQWKGWNSNADDYGLPEMTGVHIESSELVGAQEGANSSNYDVRKAFINSFMDSGYWAGVKAKVDTETNFDVLIAILDPLWDDKDDEEALRSIANALEVGLIDFAYIYITGPECEARAKLTLAIFSNVLKPKAKDQIVRIRWLPLYKCNTAAGKCSDTYNGVKYIDLFGKGGESMGYKCPSVCGHKIDNQLDKVLHEEWRKLTQGLKMDGAHGPVKIAGFRRTWINWAPITGSNPFMCDGAVNQDAVKWFQQDLSDAFKQLNTNPKGVKIKDVKISVVSAAPLTGAAELLTALYNLQERPDVTLQAVNFMGGFGSIGRKAKPGELKVGDGVFVLDGCSNWMFDVGGTTKVMQVLIDNYKQVKVNFLPSFPLMKNQVNEHYGAYINTFLNKQPPPPEEIKKVATLFKIERSMFTTARQGVNYAGDAIDMPNRCSWPIRLANVAPNEDVKKLLGKINLAYLDKCLALGVLIYGENGKNNIGNLKNAYFPVGNLKKYSQVFSWIPSATGVVQFATIQLTKEDQLGFLASEAFQSEKLTDHGYDYVVHNPDGATKKKLQEYIHERMNKWATSVVAALVEKLNTKNPPSITDLFADTEFGKKVAKPLIAFDALQATLKQLKK